MRLNPIGSSTRQRGAEEPIFEVGMKTLLSLFFYYQYL